MEKIIKNMTPHAVNIFLTKNGEESVMIVKPSGIVARVATKTVVTDIINDIPVTSTEFGKVEGLPAPEDGIIYIVSSLVAQRCADRNDVFIPSEPVRDEAGRIIGCRSLGRI